jgi:hypothetical protein
VWVDVATDAVVPDDADVAETATTDGLAREDEADALSNMSKKAMSSSSLRSMSAAKLVLAAGATVPLVVATVAAVTAVTAVSATAATVIQEQGGVTRRPKDM